MRRIAVLLAICVMAALGVLASTAVAGHGCHGTNPWCSTTPTTTPSTTTTPTTTSPATPPTPVPVGSLLFGDEFNGRDGSLPASTLWGVKTYHDANGVAYFNGWNQISEDGVGDLDIQGVKQADGSWNSGFIAGTVTYSGARYVEARAKVPCGYGTWAAPVWETGHGAPQLENDVIEQLGREPQTYHSTLHYWTAPGVGTQSGKTITANAALCDGFHTYGSAVYSDHVDFYLDGQKMASTAASAVGLMDLTAWQDEVNINLDMGGNWAGTPSISGPVSLLVDYVHVYRLATSAQFPIG